MWSRSLAFLLLATLALAGSDQLAPTDVLGYVLDVVRADWNGDGVLDRAVLWQPQAGEDLANLYVFLSGEDEPVVATGIAWSRFGGQEAWLESDPRGFSVLSGGNAGGLEWQEGLAIGFDANGPRVVGYSYHSYEANGSENGFVCTADFAAGKGNRNGTAFAIAGGAVPLAEWSFEKIPVPCRAH
ncbi:hypothetical protein [Oceanithermus sp.]